MPIPSRPFGSAGFDLPVLGLGAMDTPHSPAAFETVALALDLGLRFIDTARDYEGSEHLLGRVVREHGAADAFFASKTFRRTASSAQYEVDRSRQVLGLDTIHLYQLHDVSTLEAWAQVTAPGGALEGLQAARERGAIRHIGISTHSLEVARLAIESGAFDAIMLEYSAFYPESRPLLDLSGERGVAVVVMRPLGGSGRTSSIRGLLARGAAGILTPANLLRYALSHPAVSVVIPGARYPDRVRENAAAAEAFRPLDPAEMRELEAAAARLYE
ncbi:MAG: aldo/keto reductase [Tepidiforma sp.]|nr:MAG: aldo/keto reductase [Tepidiforma sp.]